MNCGYFMTKLQNNEYEYIILVNSISPDSCSVCMNIMNRGLIRYQSENSEFELIITNNPMILSK